MHTHMYAHIVDVCIFMYLRSFMTLQHMRIPGVIGTRCMAVLAVAYACGSTGEQAETARNDPQRLHGKRVVHRRSRTVVRALLYRTGACRVLRVPEGPHKWT